MLKDVEKQPAILLCLDQVSGALRRPWKGLNAGFNGGREIKTRQRRAKKHCNVVMIRYRFLLTACLIADPAASQAQTVLLKPYVQPGDGSELDTVDVKVLCWLTDQTPGDFVVEYDFLAPATEFSGSPHYSVSSDHLCPLQ